MLRRELGCLVFQAARLVALFLFLALQKEYPLGQPSCFFSCSQKDVPLKERLLEALGKKERNEDKILGLVSALTKLNPTSAPARSPKAGNCYCIDAGWISLHYNNGLLHSRPFCNSVLRSATACQIMELLIGSD